jgi:SAM-dependent methyltransferase
MALMSTNKSRWDAIWNIENEYWFQDAGLRQEIIEIVSNLCKPGSIILDVGCGKGEYLQCINSNGYDAFGLDVSHKALIFCQSKKVICASADYLPIPDGSVDLILAILTIEHIKEDKPVFREFSRILRSKGFIVMMVPRTYSLAGIYITIIEPIRKKIRRVLTSSRSVYDLLSVHRTFTRGDISSWATYSNLNILCVNYFFASVYSRNLMIRLLGFLLKKLKLFCVSDEILVVMSKDQGTTEYYNG